MVLPQLGANAGACCLECFFFNWNSAFPTANTKDDRTQGISGKKKESSQLTRQRLTCASVQGIKGQVRLTV